MSLQPSRYDQYWRLDNNTSPWAKAEQLKQVQGAGYEVKNNIDNIELSKLVERVEFGKICYDKCTDSELTRFATDRGLVKRSKKLRRRWLLETLRTADQDLTFSRFLDLPPELRKQIYHIYVSEFAGRALRMPAQPPPARTCRLLKGEVLPISYSECAFQIDLEGRDVDYYTRRFRLSDETYIFLSSLKQESMGNISRFRLNLSLRLGTGGKMDLGKSDINLWSAEEQDRITTTETRGIGPLLDQRASETREEMSKVLDMVIERTNGGKLRFSDSFALARAAENAFGTAKETRKPRP